MTRIFRAAWLGIVTLALAMMAGQGAIAPIAGAQSAVPSAASGGLGTLADFEALVQPLGFTGSSSPTADGTPRWLAQRATDGATAEAIGPEDALSEVTFALKVPTAADSSTQLQDLVTFMTKYSIGGEFYVIAAIGMAAVGNQDQTQVIDDRSVHVTTTAAGDGTQVLVEITPATGAEGSGGLPTFAIPSFEVPSFAIPSFEVPSFAIPSFAIPSFTSDAELTAKFPATIDGQPVTNVSTFLFVDLLRFGGQTDEQLQALSQALASFGIDLATVSSGTANATVDGDQVQLSALRTPGANASDVAAHYNELAAAVSVAMGQPAPTAQPTMTQANLGGKSVLVSTDSSGNPTYLYPSGDTLWSLEHVTEDQATKILAALQ